MIELIAAAAATIFGYVRTRSFVERRLAFVDAIHTPGAPILAGIGAAVLVTPLAWALPLIGTGTALLVGGGVGAGVAAGRRGLRRRITA